MKMNIDDKSEIEIKEHFMDNKLAEIKILYQNGTDTRNIPIYCSVNVVIKKQDLKQLLSDINLDL